MNFKSFRIKNKILTCGMVVITTSLFAAALISNLGFNSINAFAQNSQNATQQQEATAPMNFLNFTQNVRMLAQELGLNTTSSSGEIRDAVQQIMANPNFEQFSQRLSQLAQQNGLNVTSLEPASPDADIMSRLQNFTEFIEAREAGLNMTSSE